MAEKGCECVPTAALSPSVSDYWEGRHQYKNSRFEGSQVCNLMKSSGARPTSGVVTWLRKQLPKCAENHNIDMLGHMPEQSLSPADWVRIPVATLAPAYCLQSPGHTHETSTKHSGATF